MLLFVAVALLGATTARAAPPAQISGKVVAVEDGKARIAVEGELPAWLKRNAPVKFEGGFGKVLEVSDAGAAPVVITVKTKQASTLKVDGAITLQKGKSMAGC